MIIFGLCRKGYFNGNPEIALKSPSNLVLELLKYESNMCLYEDILQEMNKDG